MLFCRDYLIHCYDCSCCFFKDSSKRVSFYTALKAVRNAFIYFIYIDEKVDAMFANNLFALQVERYERM